MPPRLREAEPGHHHEGERAGGEVHGQPSVHGRQRARARRQDRVQHARGPAVGLRLRQLAGAAGLGDGDRRPRRVQPPAHAPTTVPGASAAAGRRRRARPRPRGAGETREGAGGEAEEPEEPGLARPPGHRSALGAPGDRPPRDAVERRGGGGRGGRFRGRHRVHHDEQHPRSSRPRDGHARPSLRRLRLCRRRQVQVQRPRGEVYPRQGRRGRLRVQAQHRRQRLREMSAVPLRSTLGTGHRQGCQRMQRLASFFSSRTSLSLSLPASSRISTTFSIITRCFLSLPSLFSRFPTRQLLFLPNNWVQIYRGYFFYDLRSIRAEEKFDRRSVISMLCILVQLMDI